ncbi:MAG: hypothetical protein IIY62_03610 [Kiritimatiellae bacterium]|nr:hypothetical protein [Kiritimatiellia bacterium]
MSVLAAALVLALSRAEIIARFRAPPVTKVSGLVQVVADCPADMRLEYQSPIAGFAADLCRTLYRVERMQEPKFADPGLVICLGDVRTNLTNVVARIRTRDGGAPYTRLYLPAPGAADLAALRRETVKAFYLAVKGETVDDAEADRRLMSADPSLRAADEYARLARWLAGERVEEDDEHYLRLSRSVLEPGVARPEDVTRFASRLFLYPEVYSSPFCGKYDCCSFRDAIAMARKDVRIRFLAYAKSPQVVAYGGGRGDLLLEAAMAYSVFLRELAAYTKSEEELRTLLEDADTKLNVAMEDARLRAEGKKR